MALVRERERESSFCVKEVVDRIILIIEEFADRFEPARVGLNFEHFRSMLGTRGSKANEFPIHLIGQ